MGGGIDDFLKELGVGAKELEAGASDWGSWLGDHKLGLGLVVLAIAVFAAKAAKVGVFSPPEPEVGWLSMVDLAETLQEETGLDGWKCLSALAAYPEPKVALGFLRDNAGRTDDWWRAQSVTNAPIGSDTPVFRAAEKSARGGSPGADEGRGVAGAALNFHRDPMKYTVKNHGGLNEWDPDKAAVMAAADFDPPMWVPHGGPAELANATGADRPVDNHLDPKEWFT